MILLDYAARPGELLVARAKDGLYPLVDINFRVRSGKDTTWKSFSTATRRAPVHPLAASEHTLAAADLAPTLPADVPLTVKRYWQSAGGQLVLRFELTNKTTASIEIGALGIPMIFNNILQDKHLDEAHTDKIGRAHG